MSKSLYIAEKPSVAQEFAKALRINGQRKDETVQFPCPLIQKHHYKEALHTADFSAGTETL